MYEKKKRYSLNSNINSYSDSTFNVAMKKKNFFPGLPGGRPLVPWSPGTVIAVKLHSGNPGNGSIKMSFFQIF